MIGLRLVFSITLALVGLFSSVAAEGQQAAKIARIGFLVANGAANPHLREAFLKGLRDLGYVEGRNADALTVLTSTTLTGERRRLVNLAAKNRLPAVCPWREGVDAGGLMSYGPNGADMFRCAATYVDRILKGTKPGDLPVEQPTKFELVNQPQGRQGPRPDDPAAGAGAGGPCRREMNTESLGYL